MKYIQFFHELGKKENTQVGGKGASLASMYQAGFPVPQGFVFTIAAYTQFYNKNLPEKVKEELFTAFDKLQCERVAVRSSTTTEDSSTASWAGQLESYLNVTKPELLKAIKQCWQSIQSERAKAYIKQQNIPKSKLIVAVVIQKMVESDISGIMFTTNPMTNNAQELMIEASYGLGELLVQGKITPDNYVLSKPLGKLKNQTLGSQKVMLTYQNGKNKKIPVPKTLQSKRILNNRQLHTLTKLGKQIETYYGSPQDIEWAIANEQFHIIQSRPISPLSKTASHIEKLTELIKRDKTQIDWSGVISVLHITLARNGHFSRMRSLFGVEMPYVYVDYRKGLASGNTPITANKALGVYYVNLLRNDKELKAWCKAYRQSGKRALEAISVSPEIYLKNLDTIIPLYDTHATYQIATKLVYSFLSPDIDFYIMHQLETTRKEYENFFKVSSAKATKVCAFLATRFPIYTPQLMQCLTLQEIYSLQKDEGKLPSRKELQKRFAGTGIYLTEKETIFLDREHADRIQESWAGNISSFKDIKGQTAYPGIVRGKCKIITHFQGATIKKGEILITGMTHPNFTPLLKNSAAIVTDGGGLLSHAAIIARELKKPCIVGTKIGTKILKDGDSVEVNADKGTIRLLQSSS